MKLDIDRNSLESLFPFFLMIDHTWRIVLMGRSASKLFPDLKPGSNLLDEFALPPLFINPSLLDPEVSPGARKSDPEELMASIVLLERVQAVSGVKVRLRGQIVRTRGGEFLLAVAPVMTDLKGIRPLGLDFSDFSLLDPVFDLLLLIRSEQRALVLSEESRRRLEWEKRVADLLHRLVVRAVEVGPSNFEDLLRETMREVSQTLGFQFAHICWATEAGDTLSVRSENGTIPVERKPHLYWTSDAERFQSLIQLSERMCFRRGEGLPGSAWAAEKVIAIGDVRHDHRFIRRGAVSDFPEPLTAFFVPLHTGGKIAVIMEFFSSVVLAENFKRLTEVFELLAHHLGLVLDHISAAEREKMHIAQLAISSKLSSLGEMSGGIAHEINNPLAAIQLMSSQLAAVLKSGKPIESSRQIEMLQKISASSDRIARIVRGLRMISRDSSLDAMEAVAVRPLIEETLSFCEGRFSSHGVSLTVVAPEEEIRIRANSVQVSQVLLNLIGNAFDAVVAQESGEKWVRLEASVLGKFAEIAVVDSGPGVSEEIAEKIMQPFFTTKPVGKGTGLGLSISRGIIEAHGGRLRLDRSGPHTRFVMILPCETADAQAARRGASDAASSRSGGRRAS